MSEVVYICPICFTVYLSPRNCHQHETVECQPGSPGDESRKPVEDRFGHDVSRAPRWYLEALEKIRKSKLKNPEKKNGI